MQTHEDGPLSITKFDSLGPYGNNAYLVADREAGEAIIVDMPAGSRACAGRDRRTQDHGDCADPHAPGPLGGLRPREERDGRAGAVQPGGSDHARRQDRPAHCRRRRDCRGQGCDSRAAHARPYAGQHLLPRRGNSVLRRRPLSRRARVARRRPPTSSRAIASITERLYALPDETVVLPGHGGDTTIGDSKREYAVFASREHPPDLGGDVTWAG